MMQNGSVLAPLGASTDNPGNYNTSMVTEVMWTGTTWVTEYENQTVNTTQCPIFVQRVHILPNPWDDATWILTSAFVIFTMQSGFGLLESGTATAKNEVNIMVKNAVDVIFGGIAYWMVGYAFSFGDSKESNAFSGWGNFFLTVGMNVTSSETIGWEYSNFIFQLAFATTATTIVSGAMVERTRLEAYIIFSFINTFIYSFPSHWVWAQGGFLKKLGVVDIAGAGPVHVAGGTTGLVATLVLRPRHRRYKTNTPPPMGSPTNALLGMFMLWWGWLGFNCGSTHGITSSKWALAARSAVATICSSMAGGMVGIILSYISKRRKFDIGYLINGVLGSLVSITALCTICTPKFSLLIGAIGGCIACGGIELLIHFHIDDPVGVIPVHFMCGIWSLLSAGLFASKEPDINPDHKGLLMGGGGYLLGVQTATALSIVVWCAVLSYIFLKIINVVVGLRFPFQEELLGADIVEHSIGPRKYDKVQKRLTDTSRVRAYDLRRRKKYSASFRAAEHYLSQQEAGILSVSEAVEPPSMRQKIKKSKHNNLNSPPYSRKPHVLSNGHCNGESSTKNQDLLNHHFPVNSPHNLSEIQRGLNDRRSMRRIHGAFRRKRVTKAPKWQQKLGVDNLAYLEQDENEINGFRCTSVTKAAVKYSSNGRQKKINTDADVSDTDDIEMDDIDIVVVKRSQMVSTSTQTIDWFEQGRECQHCEPDIIAAKLNDRVTTGNSAYVTSISSGGEDTVEENHAEEGKNDEVNKNEPETEKFKFVSDVEYSNIEYMV